MKKIYDSEYDILVIKIENHYDFGKTIEMEEGVLLDFDKNNIPVAIEILDASKRFNVPRYSLKNIPEFNMKIQVNDEVIKVYIELAVIIHNKKLSETWNGLTGNNEHIPVIEVTA